MDYALYYRELGKQKSLLKHLCIFLMCNIFALGMWHLVLQKRITGSREKRALFSYFNLL